MKSMIITTAAAVLMLASATAAHAQAQTKVDGNELLTQCEATDRAGREYCNGFVVGVSQMFHETGMYGVHTCPTGVIPQRQLVDIVVKQLRAEPENRHIEARYLISGALVRAFPCPANSGGK